MMPYKLKTLVYILLMLCLAGFEAIAQVPDQQVSGNRTWVFGTKAGMNFNPPAPAPITTNLRQALPNWFTTAASISGNNGQLLMYSVLDTIWDKNGNVLQNGAGLLPATVSSILRLPLGEQSTLILPFLNDTNKFYVFSLTSSAAAASTPPPDPQNLGKLYYSVVDMTLNGGLGGVVPGQKGILLDSLLYERIVSIKGDQCKTWLVTMTLNGTSFNSTSFHAFEINDAGINTSPVISNTTTFAPAGFTAALYESSVLAYTGIMCASPDDKKLAVAINGGAIQTTTRPYESYIGGFQLFDFNNSTGVVSNQLNILKYKTYNTPGALGPLIDLLTMLLDVLSAPTGGIAFSPDNSKVYTTHGVATANNALRQYNLSSGTEAGIRASEQQIAGTSKISIWNSMRLGADNKVYMSGFTNPSPPIAPETKLHLITNPNLSGAATAFTFDAVNLPAGSSCSISLGQPTSGLPPADTVFASKTVSLCAPATSLVLSVPSDPAYSYLWDDGSSSNTRTVTGAGTYWVMYGLYCPKQIDTFIVNDVDITFSLGNDTVICGDIFPFDLKGPIVAGATYLWQDGSAGPTFNVSGAGVYSLTVAKGDCTASDEIRIDNFNVFQDLGPDTMVCARTPFTIRLDARVPEGASVLWSTGATSPGIDVSQPGTYGVSVTQNICVGTDSITIRNTELCDCIAFMPNAFTPNGDGLNDVFTPIVEPACTVRGYNFQVFNRWGERVFSTVTSEKGWDGTFNGKPADPGTYWFTISFEKGTRSHPFTQKGDFALVR